VLAVVDFGSGNLGSLRSALARRGAEYVMATTPDELAAGSAAILPGDGAFGATMQALVERGFEPALRAHVAAGKPLLGICVGMQVLFESSDEYGEHRGFGFLPGRISRFADAPRVPHMGWNELKIVRDHPFLDGVHDGDYAYFLHSYRVVDSPAAIAECEYGERFAAIVAHDNIVATQFHPEKSQHTGALLLDNFLRNIVRVAA
jgi:glutamine amidotransferase